MFVVVAYDVADDRRRVRVLKLLKGYGEHVQESVFECDLEPKVYQQMVKRLKKVVNHEEDSVRFYHLCRADIGRIAEMGIGRPVEEAREFEII